MEISRVETTGSPDIVNIRYNSDAILIHPKRYKHSFLVTINRTSYFQCIHGGLPTDREVNMPRPKQADPCESSYLSLLSARILNQVDTKKSCRDKKSSDETKKLLPGQE